MVTELLTANEVANILGIDLRTVYRLTSSRQLAHIRIGRSVRVTADDLAKFIHNHREEVIDYEAEADTRCA